MNQLEQMSMDDSAAALKAVEILGHLLEDPNSPNRVEKAQNAVGIAKACARALHELANGTENQKIQLEAHRAMVLASHADRVARQIL